MVKDFYYLQSIYIVTAILASKLFFIITVTFLFFLLMNF